MRKSTLEFVSAPFVDFDTAFRKARNTFRLLCFMCFLSLAATSVLLAIELVNYPGGVNRLYYFGMDYIHVVLNWLNNPVF